MIATRIAAAVLALLSVLPLWRLLPQRATGLAGAATAELAATYTALLWNGLLIALIPALLATLLLDGAALERTARRVIAPLARPSKRWFAIALAILAALLALAVALIVMNGRATLIDSFAQLTQARYFAAGRLAGPVLSAAPSFEIQQMLVTPNGWVSQYPPGHIALLALGFVVGSAALIGPLMHGLAVFFIALISEDLFDDVATARFAALLAAISPFMLGLSGAYMSHVPAAACAAAAIFFTLRADRAAGWSIAAGASIGALFAIRPLTGVVIGIVALVYGSTRDMSARARATRVTAAIAGALPFLIAVALYNRHFFGSATTFGYTAALGPNAALGFGIDPWGNRYGIVEAFAYTSAELVALSMHLLETPLPLVLLIGIHFASRPSRPSRPLRPSRPSPHSPAALVFWAAAAPVFANMFYWHHGLLMGPRMLADVGPFWVLLAVLCVTGLISRIRADWFIAGKYSVRVFTTAGALAALLAGVFILTPERLLSYAPPAGAAALLRAPATARPAIVFVHGGWSARVAMRLAGHGMRLDSVETALRQNSTCAVHHYSLAYARGEAADLKLDFTPRAVGLPPVFEIVPGDRIRVAPREKMDAACAAQIAADSAGVVDVTPFLWQGDLPGLAPRGALFARDMSAEENAALLRGFPQREALELIVDRNGRQQLRPYAPHVDAKQVGQ